MARNLLGLGILPIWLTLLSNLACALSPITVKGSRLYDSDGEQFFLKGVAYVSTDNPQLDPLLDSKRCQVDAGLMKTLGANTIRVYTVDATQNHDACMSIFAEQDIYVWLELTSGDNYIDRDDPAWTMGMYKNWSATMDTFAGYDNILTFNYLACGDQDDTIDLYGMAVYNWCRNSSYYSSGYNKIYEEFENLNIPVLFAEMGCKLDGEDRTFDDVSTILGPVFDAVFSGAIVWQWNTDDKGYGIVEYDNKTYTAFPTTLDEYNSLATVFSTASPTGAGITAYTPSNPVPACPTMDSASRWLVDAEEKLPTISGLNIDTVTARTTRKPATTGASGEPSPTDPASPGKGGASGDGGLSTGAKAGIAVGCVLAGIIVLGIIAVCFIRKRRAKTQNDDEKDKMQAGIGAGGSNGQFKHELPAQSVGQVLPRLEMDGSQIPPQELDGRGIEATGSAVSRMEIR